MQESAKPSRAKLRLDGIMYVFDYDPQDFKVSYSTDVASNQVLDATNPDIRSKSVATTYKLGKCYLISAGLKETQDLKLGNLQSFVLSRRPLSFTYGNINAGLVYITSMDVSIKQWQKGKPSFVEIDLDLKQARLTPKAVSTAPAITQTAAMRERSEKAIAQILKSPAKQAQFGVNGKFKVSTDSQGIVNLINGAKTQSFKLSDFGIK